MSNTGYSPTHTPTELRGGMLCSGMTQMLSSILLPTLEEAQAVCESHAGRSLNWQQTSSHTWPAHPGGYLVTLVPVPARS
jgi:hypothetical protein